MTKLSLAVLLSFIIISCSEDHKEELIIDPVRNDVKIASISGIGDLIYDASGKLLAIGNETLFYDASGRVSGSRVFQRDSTLRRTDGSSATYYITERTERSSYIWENYKLKERNLDTLLFKSYFTAVGSPGPFQYEPDTAISLKTNFFTDKFFYSDIRIDSVYYPANNASAFSSGIRFIYNKQGDLVKIIENTIREPSILFPVPLSSKTEYEITYDDKPNPFYYLYRRTGVILNKLRAFNISPHNPVQIKVTGPRQSPVSATVDITYEYNTSGYPVKMTHRQVGQIDRTVSLKYN